VESAVRVTRERLEAGSAPERRPATEVNAPARRERIDGGPRPLGGRGAARWSGRMRLVFVNSSRIWGGNEKWTCEAAAGLGRRGHDVLLIGGSPLMAKRAKAYGIDFHNLRLRGDGDLVGVLRLSRRFRGFGPDAVILTKSKEYWLGGLAAKLARVRRVCFRIGIDRRVQRNIKYRLLFGRICDTFIVNAGSVRDTLLEAPFIDAESVAVVRNGVDSDGRPGGRGAGPDERLLRSIGVPPGAVVVGATGRLAKQKGFDVLLAAFAQVRRQCPEAFLVIAGEGHERRSLTDEIRRLGLSGSVSLPGFVENMTGFYDSLSLFCLPSRFEGMPNVLLEAMAAGVPLVATRVSGVGELVAEGETGLLVPPEDASGLAEAIVELLSDESLRSGLADRARRMVEAEYSMDRMLDDLEAVLAGGRRSRR
jgi:glycosyltransferase involved in cell wall biosynthesis